MHYQIFYMSLAYIYIESCLSTGFNTEIFLYFVVCLHSEIVSFMWLRYCIVITVSEVCYMTYTTRPAASWIGDILVIDIPLI